MKNKGFSLAEITVAIVIVGILVTLGLPLVGNIYQDSQAKVCETNQLTIKTALDVYAMEHETIPGSISQIPGNCFERAYAKVMSRPDAWQRRLAYFIVDLKDRGIAYAANDISMKALSKGNFKLITCPLDKTPPQQGGYSYGLNSNIKNISSREYQNLPDDIILIMDCDKSEFTSEADMASRHAVLGFAMTTMQVNALAVTKGNQKGKVSILLKESKGSFNKK